MSRKQRRTQSRAEAARANGAKSHGPTTPEGKAKSALNGLRHGAFAKTTLIDTESAEALDCLVNDYIRDWEPQNESQLKIVYRMASATWRQQRAQSIEAAMVNDKMQEQYLALAERNLGHGIDANTRAGLAECEMYGPNGRLKAIQNAADLCERQFSRALRDLERAKKLTAEPKGFRSREPKPEPQPESKLEPQPPPTPEPEPQNQNPEPEPPPQPPPAPEPEKRNSEPNAPEPPAEPVYTPETYPWEPVQARINQIKGPEYVKGLPLPIRTKKS